MKTIDYDRLASSSPINRDAGLAYSGGGERYETKHAFTIPAWDAPPRLKPLPPDAPNLVGLKVGRLTVLGLLAENPRSGIRGAWVVRCSCGTYTMRTAKAVRNPLNTDDMCERCGHLRTLKKRAADPKIMALAGTAKENRVAARRDRQLPPAPLNGEGGS